MDLEYVYLKGNRLLAALNNVQELTWTPKSRFQRLLGSNGSGKSSLLRELSPLSAILIFIFNLSYIYDNFDKS
jgi:ABC-type molybdenum transport system ATPase subunit/photorepair protein PhrA